MSMAKHLKPLVCALALCAKPAWAQAPAPFGTAPPPPPGLQAQTLAVHPLGRGVFWVSGGIADTGFLIGKAGVIAIDSQMFVGSTQQELSEIRRLTDEPVNVVILTHSDPDHINGLPGFPPSVQVIAQSHASAKMKRLVLEPRSNGTPPPPGISAYLPSREVEASENVVIDGIPLHLIHVAPAHTDGDLIVYLPESKIAFVGDLVGPGGGYPIIHLEKHGSSLGWIASVKRALELDADTYVSGHYEPVSKAFLRQELEATERRRAQIANLVMEKKSLAETKAALHVMPAYGIAARFPDFTETTYLELTRDPGLSRP